VRLATRISVITFLSVAVAAGLVAFGTIGTRAILLRQDFQGSAVGICEVLAMAMASPLASSSRHAEVQQILDNVANYPDRHPDVEVLEVLDTEGVVVAHTNPVEFGRLRDDRQTRKDLALAAPALRTIPGNKLRVVVPIHLAYPLGVLRGTFRLDRLDASVQRESTLLGGGAFVGAVFLAGVMFVLLRRNVTRRIEVLARQVTAFRERRSTRIGVAGSDEVAELGGVFNEMAAELERYTTDLEQTVESRTSELRVANRRLEELAITDGLTGLHNHRHFQGRLRRDLEIARRAGRPLSIVMFDVDHFKAYNDTYGHPAGDEVLRRVAEALRHEARAADLVARYGGEEFVVAMPDADRDAAHAAAERIRRHVLAEGVVTISGGIATFPADGVDAETLIERADRALYRAKREGRDRIAPGAEAA
jgi:diguanylate cyclase (GGDEF)-like protein